MDHQHNYEMINEMKLRRKPTCLFFFRIIPTADREVSHFVRVLRGGNDSEVITELVLLQESLRKIFQLTLGEFQVGRTGNRKLSAVLGDDNITGSQSTSLSSDLNSFLKVGLKKVHIEDLVVHWLRAVDHELDDVLLSLDLMIQQPIIY